MMPAVSEVDAVLCDAGGVLLMPDPAMLRTLLSPLGVSPTDSLCERAHFDAMRELDCIGCADYAASHRSFARSVGVAVGHLEDAARAVSDLYVRHPLVPVPAAAASLRRLSQAGLTLGIVSNASGTMADQLARHQVCSVDGGEAVEVRVVVDSEVVGVEKPDPGIFQIALDAIAVSPHRCLYVGDSVHFDVNGAQSVGLRPVHIDPYHLCADSTHAHARCLADFTDALLGSRQVGAYRPER